MIQIKNLHKKYGGVQVHENFSYTFPKGKITAITGRSGIGKTTLLRCIAGLEEYSGDIKVEGKLGYMFQEDRLMPWLSIEENLLLPIRLEGRRITPSDRQKLMEMARFFRVEEHLQKGVNAVSGGEKQRLLMVRALICEPEILLLDEPFKSLDEVLYMELYKKLKDYCSLNGISVIFVTHHKVLAKGCDITLKF